MLTKSDFLLFRKAPMHLWAKAHRKLEINEQTDFSRFLADQGYDVEGLAIKYFHEILLPRYPDAELIWQHTYADGIFAARSDGIIHDKKDDAYDVFEIKQSTKIDSENEYDITYQTLVYQANLPIRNVHILHLNKEYVRQGEIDLEELFVIDNLNEVVEKRAEEVRQLRELAYQVVTIDNPSHVEACTNPDKCPCPSLCHPDLPQYPIYDLMGAKGVTLKKLRNCGLINLIDITDETHLSEKQEHQIEAVRCNTPYVDTISLQNELNSLTFPIYFLDYETCGFAIPLFDGYKPQKPMVFQYSLHILDEQGTLTHNEYLSITQEDPCPPLLEKLSTEIGPEGSVLVWNKTFETGRNSEMAERYPEYADFLTGVNQRIYDLADPVKDGVIIHPDFHGSWSIKNVLPVLVSGLTYKGLDISKGDQAMSAWLKLIHNITLDDEPDWIKGNDHEQIKHSMLKYCELDTLAMVEILKAITHGLITETIS